MAGPAAKAQPAHRQPRAAAAFPREAPGTGSRCSGSEGPLRRGRAVLQRALLRRAGPGPAGRQRQREREWAGSRNGPATGTGMGTGIGREPERAVPGAQGRSRHKGERNPALPSSRQSSLRRMAGDKECPNRAVKDNIPALSGPALACPRLSRKSRLPFPRV